MVTDRPEDGTELTYTEFELDSRDDVQRLASGKPVQAHFNERYLPPKSKSSNAEREAKTPKRKRA